MIFGIGTDILNITRIENCLNRHPQRFVEKLLSTQERDEYEKKTNQKSKVNYLAKRWAAKEAFSKACGTGIRPPVSFTNISLIKDKMGKPNIQTNPDLTQWLAAKKIITSHISLSDENETIVAFVVLEK